MTIDNDLDVTGLTCRGELLKFTGFCRPKNEHPVRFRIRSKQHRCVSRLLRIWRMDGQCGRMRLSGNQNRNAHGVFL